MRADEGARRPGVAGLGDDRPVERLVGLVHLDLLEREAVAGAGRARDHLLTPPGRVTRNVSTEPPSAHQVDWSPYSQSSGTSTVTPCQDSQRPMLRPARGRWRRCRRRPAPCPRRRHRPGRRRRPGRPAGDHGRGADGRHAGTPPGARPGPRGVRQTGASGRRLRLGAQHLGQARLQVTHRCLLLAHRRAQGGDPAGHPGPHRPLAHTGEVGDLGVLELFVVAQDDRGALHLGQRLAGQPEPAVVVEGVAGRARRVGVAQLGHRRLPALPPPPPRRVRVDDHPAHVGVDVLDPRDPRPARQRAGERLLDHVLGVGAVAGQRVGEAQQPGAARGDPGVEVDGASPAKPTSSSSPARQRDLHEL